MMAAVQRSVPGWNRVLLGRSAEAKPQAVASFRLVVSLPTHVPTRCFTARQHSVKRQISTPNTLTTDIMETVEELDADIADLQDRVATLNAHRANLATVLLSQPHLATRLENGNQQNKSTQTAKRLVKEQVSRNLDNIHRACAGVTAYKVRDPDPNAINNGNILGVSIDVSISGKFIETYHVLLNFTEREDGKLLRIHKHTIPPCIPLQQLANRWLPNGKKDLEDAPETEQDLVRFGRRLRKELVAWHMRVHTLENLRKEAGLKTTSPTNEKEDGPADTGKILNAFVSDDGASSDEEGADDGHGNVRIVDVEADAAVREIAIVWSDGRTAVMTISKDGRIEKAACRAKGGVRDVGLSRRAMGPMSGLLRRLAV